MSVSIRYPNITASNEKDQLQQVRSYLHQLVDQLNMTLEDVGTAASSQNTALMNRAPAYAEKTKQDPVDTFNSIKALIIKSADIVEAYYDQINYRMQSVYVAESEFGTYKEANDKAVRETANATSELYSNVQSITSNVQDINDQLHETDAYIKRGHLYDDDAGFPVYGIEIGQTNKDNGVETFAKFARFTADRLEFYYAGDQENPIAYISGTKLYITTVQVLDIFQLGGFEDDVQEDGSVLTMWVGV